jgi:poly-gamma-glutamate synthase PgsB/CapB
VSFICFILFSIYLIYEILLLRKKIKKIPLRICVTGTRGKSTVTRLIASILREGGFKVLSKTTGSKPVIIYPDGSEEEINRKGHPSILEGKKIIKIAEKLKVDAMILEMMSIHPECGVVESKKILKPHILIITNVRLDHIAQMGESKEDIARCFASYIPSKCTVFIPEEEFYSVFQTTAKNLNSKLIKISKDFSRKYIKGEEKLFLFEFEENIRLAYAVSDFLGIDRDTVLRGIKKAKQDFGHLKVWTLNSDSFLHHCYLINCFAVNDPESTKNAISYLRRTGFLNEKKIVGVLNLRSDRGDRSLQWLKALQNRMFSEFQEFYFIGKHSRVLKRKLKLLKIPVFILKSKNSKKIMEKILEKEKSDFVLIGMGNIGGIGEKLVSYWEKIGRPYDF